MTDNRNEAIGPEAAGPTLQQDLRASEERARRVRELRRELQDESHATPSAERRVELKELPEKGRYLDIRV